MRPRIQRSTTANTYEPSTVLRPMKYSQYQDNYMAEDAIPNYNNHFSNHYNNTDNGYNQDTSNGSFYNEHNTTNTTYHNGNANSSLMEHQDDQTPLNSCLKQVTEKQGVDENDESTVAEAYPTLAKPSPSLQIIATRNRPCCECVKANNRAPVCLLFLVFLLVSCCVITGVMIYLKSGTTRCIHGTACIFLSCNTSQMRPTVLALPL